MSSSAGAVLVDSTKSADKLDKSECLNFMWGEPEPYIGKLIKIWENGDKSKKIKVQWFFRPSEILYYLKDESYMWNEIFLASGEGIGIANVNPLEAIAGKCNVICISKDIRNRQPSEEELKVADYVFYRVFDVGRFTLDEIGDMVGGLEVKFVFNRNESEKACPVLKHPSDQNEDTNATVVLNRQNSSNGSKIEKDDGNSSCVVLKKDELEVTHGDGNAFSSQLDSRTETVSTAMDQIEDKVANEIILEESLSADKTACGEFKNKEDDSYTNPHMNAVGVEENKQNIKNSGASDSWASKQVKLDSAMPLEYEDSNSNKRSNLNDTKPQVGGVTASAYNEKTDNVKDHGMLDKVMKSGKDSTLELDRPWKKAKIDFSATICEDKNKSNVHKPIARSGENGEKVLPKAVNSSHENMPKASKISVGLNNNSNSKIPCTDDTKSLVKTSPSAAVKANTKAGQVTHSCEMGQDDKSGKDSFVIEDKTSNKAKVDIFDNIFEDGKYNVQRSSIKREENEAKVLFKATDSFKERAIIPKATHVMDNGLPKAKSSMKPNNPSNNILSLGGASTNETEEFHDKGIEVTPRHVESITWFKELSWEERMQSANDQGTLVLLQNLDPEFTSGEVEDIIWHAFNEKCSAKMIQRSACSNPYTGQALAIFKTRDATERVLRKLDTSCLVVSDQRPLVADIIELPKSKRNTASFVGHLVIDKFRHQMNRDMKEAVSTSHCSQPNTIEYEMAMDWRLLQSRSEFCLNNLHKEHREEWTKVTADLKTK